MPEEVLVLGDSHTVVFKSTKFKTCFPDTIFTVLDVGGATVSGLTNPNSITRAMPLFELALNASSAGTTIFLIGEVDTGFVIWYRAEKYKAPVSELLDMAIDNYQGLITRASKKFPIICISTPLPTIQDDNEWSKVANARKEIHATQRARTELTLDFNKRIREFCENNGHIFLSLDEQSLGANGLVNPYFLNQDTGNHHYDMDKYADMIISNLGSHIRQAP